MSRENVINEFGISAALSKGWVVGAENKMEAVYAEKSSPIMCGFSGVIFYIRICATG